MDVIPFIRNAVGQISFSFRQSPRPGAAGRAIDPRPDIRLPARKRRGYVISQAECLELRWVLSSTALVQPDTLIAQSRAHNTLDQGQDLGVLSASQPWRYSGQIGQQGLQVDWLTFEISQPTRVELQSAGVVLSLYNDAPADFNDQLQPMGDRLLGQSASLEGPDAPDASIIRDLSAGVYHIAVSGIGNQYFNPFLADSGTPGRETGFALHVTATDLHIASNAAPTALAVDVTPLDVRVDLSGAPSYLPGIQLLDASGNAVPLQWTNFASTVSELQLAPDVALASGTYSVAVTDDQGHTQMTVPFQFTRRSDAPAGAHDTAATAIDLGTLVAGELVQAPGTIGADSYYDASSGDPERAPGNQVNLYHFHVSGETRQALVAEVFAGRMGSPLDAGVSLYRLDHATGHLQFVSGNNNAYNGVTGTTGQQPLYFDPVTMTGLTAGDYYVAVSQGFNTPAPDEGQTPGPDSGIFDPQTTHSGTAGWGEGAYVLNLRMASVPSAPAVTSTSIADGSALATPPDQISVGFNEYVNLTNLAYAAFQQTSQTSVSAVYIQNTADGTKYFPRLTRFDTSGLTATFQMLDRLPAGNYELHLSGKQGITDVAGDPLAGSAGGGDFVVQFSVDAGSSGKLVDPLVHTHVAGADSIAAPQPLGTLFPRELQTGVQIVRSAGDPTAVEHDTADFYQLHLLQEQSYVFSLAGNGLPAGVQLQLYDARQNPIDAVSPDGGQTLLAELAAGDYVVRIGDWSAGAAGSIAYTVKVNLIGQPDNAPPLFSGPAPAVSIRLASAVDPAAAPVPMPVPAPAPMQGPTLGLTLGLTLGPTSSTPSAQTSTPFQAPSAIQAIAQTPGPVQSPPASAGTFFAGTTSAPAAAVTSGAIQVNLAPDRQGPPRIVLPGTENDLVVIPASRSSSEGDGTADFRAVRNIRSIPDRNDELRPRGLADLADAPIGRDGAETSPQSQSGKTRGLMEKLTKLIASEQQAQPANTDQPAAENAASVPVPGTPESANNRGPAASPHAKRRPDSVPASGKPKLDDSAHRTPRARDSAAGDERDPSAAHSAVAHSVIEERTESSQPRESGVAAFGIGSLVLALLGNEDSQQSAAGSVAIRWWSRFCRQGRQPFRRETESE